MNVAPAAAEITPRGARDLGLVVGTGSRACALPVAHVVETMRPLPIEALSGTPPFVLGVSIVRGRPTPVVHLGHLLIGGDTNGFTRFVTLRLGQRRLSLAVGSVLGVRQLDLGEAGALPTILGSGNAEVIEAIGRLDEELLFVLRTTRILPERVWEVLRERDRAQ